MVKHIPKKYCSILTYIEHHNRPLYDAIHDLCYLMGAFNQRHEESLTFIMPTKEYTKKIIANVYGNEPQKAITQIKSLILIGLFNDVSDFSVGQEISHKASKTHKHKVASVDSKNVVFESKLIFHRNESFVPLYIPQKIAVLTMEDFDDTKTVHGGAPADIAANRSLFRFKRSIYNYMFDKVVSHMTLAPEVLKFMNDNTCPFLRVAVSFWAFVDKQKDSVRKELVGKMQPNPLSIVPVLAIYVDTALYKAWLDDTDDPDLDYSLSKYVSLMKSINKDAKQTEISVDWISKFKNSFNNGMGMLTMIREVYDNDDKKLMFDECCSIMYALADSIATKDIQKFNALRGIITKKYCGHRDDAVIDAKPILLSEAVLNNEMQPAIVAKIFEFVKSDAFAFPVAYVGRNLVEYSTVRKPPSVKENEYIVYTPLIEMCCGEKHSKRK